jgi:Ribosomal protein L11 methyltransferase (PrmA)
MSTILDEHRQYLSDSVRVDALSTAIERVVKPGDVVIDLGAGTGILGLLACRAGARRVYAIEEGGMIEVAREIVRANGYDDRVVFVRGLSTDIEVPERADVVMADQIGRFGFDAGIFEYFADARERFLKPAGVTMPAEIALQAAPVEAPSEWRRAAFWDAPAAGFDMTPAAKIGFNTGYPAKLTRDQLLAEEATLCTLDASASISSAIKADVSVHILRDGTLHGVGGWFTARLADGVCMSNSPSASSRIERSNVYFPLARAVDVRSGDTVRIVFRILPADLIVSWTVDVWKEGQQPIAHFSHATFDGMLLPREELARTSLSFVPKRSRRADARLSVLELCDGVRSLADIEDEVYRRHRDLFRSAADAAVFVAEVVTRYSVS